MELLPSWTAPSSPRIYDWTWMTSISRRRRTWWGWRRRRFRDGGARGGDGDGLVLHSAGRAPRAGSSRYQGEPPAVYAPGIRDSLPAGIKRDRVDRRGQSGEKRLQCAAGSGGTHLRNDYYPRVTKRAECL